MTPLRAREWGAVSALLAILIITAAWWGLALWPLPAETPAWVVRARELCFGTARTQLPDPAGWLTLIGQPVMMLVLLMILWGTALVDGLRALAGRRAGRVVLVVTALALFGGAGAAGVRVANAATGDTPAQPSSLDLPPDYARVDRAAPDVPLVDQQGDTVTLARFRGRPVLVTFAYGHCETVCPIAVHEVLRARERVPQAAALVITLDPWRDTPARLPHIASAWRLPQGAWVLSGPVPAVEAALDGWNVARARDPLTGAITHPALVYVVDADGRIAYVVAAHAGAIADLVNRL